MAGFVYEDGTPVPPEDLPDSMREKPSFLKSAGDVTAETLLGPLYEAKTPAGKAVHGTREAVLSTLSGGVAMPAGYAAQVGTMMIPGRGVSGGREANQFVREMLTYQPKTPEGVEALRKTGEAFSAITPRLTKDLSALAGQKLGPEAEEITGIAAHPLTWLGSKNVRSGIGQLRQAAFAPGAQRAALRTLGASPSDVGKTAGMVGQKGMHEIGQAVLDVPGAKLGRGPKGIIEPGAPNPLKKAMDPLGQTLNDINVVADDAGATVNLRILMRDFKATTPLMRDPIGQQLINKVERYVVKSEPLRAMGRPAGSIPASQAWEMRQTLDDMIFATTKELPKNTPITPELWRLRSMLDERLGESIQSVLGPDVAKEWALTNRQYHNLSYVRRLAKSGYEMQASHEYGPGQGRLRVYAGPARLPVMSVAEPIQKGYRLPAMHARVNQFLAGETGKPPFTY